MHGRMILKTLQMISTRFLAHRTVTKLVSTIVCSLSLFLNSVDNPGTQAPQLDDIRVEYHPQSGRETENFTISDFSHNHFPKPPMPDPDRDPWHPFHTLLDFELAELALEAALNKNQTERLIRLLRRAHYQREKFMIMNQSDLRATWDASGTCLTPVRIPFHYCYIDLLIYIHVESVPVIHCPRPVPEQA